MGNRSAFINASQLWTLYIFFLLYIFILLLHITNTVIFCKCKFMFHYSWFIFSLYIFVNEFQNIWINIYANFSFVLWVISVKPRIATFSICFSSVIKMQFTEIIFKSIYFNTWGFKKQIIFLPIKQKIYFFIFSWYG